MQGNAIYHPVFDVDRSTNDETLVKTKTLRPQFALQLGGGGAGFPRATIKGFRLALPKYIIEPVNILLLRWCGLFDSCKGGRCREQQQGDNEMFHENSLEAISGNVKRAA